MPSRPLNILSRTLLVLAALSAQAETQVRIQKQRCGTAERTRPPNLPLGGPADCGYATNRPQPQHQPSFFYDIRVVFHVIENTSGQGHLSRTTIQIV